MIIISVLVKNLESVINGSQKTPEDKVSLLLNLSV